MVRSQPGLLGCPCFMVSHGVRCSNCRLKHANLNIVFFFFFYDYDVKTALHHTVINYFPFRPNTCRVSFHTSCRLDVCAAFDLALAPMPSVCRDPRDPPKPRFMTHCFLSAPLTQINHTDVCVCVTAHMWPAPKKHLLDAPPLRCCHFGCLWLICLFWLVLRVFVRVCAFKRSSKYEWCILQMYWLSQFGHIQKKKHFAFL